MFQGLTTDALDFLSGIREHNEKSWFEAHKKLYLETVYQPMRELGEALFAPFSELPDFMYKVARIYRDPTFAPHLHYRDTMWIYLLYRTDYWSRTPMFFFELSPEGAAFGMKLSSPDACCMQHFRQSLIANPTAFLSLAKQLEETQEITFSGVEYKRKKPGETPQTAAFFQRKNLLAVRKLPVGKALFAPTLPDEVIRTFRALMPLVDFFCRMNRREEPEPAQAALPGSKVQEQYGGFMW